MNGAKQVVLVTGASTGIGACCAEFLAQRGYRVYGGARGEVTAPGVEPVELDVTHDRSVVRVVESIRAREGRFDVLINNAGSGIAGAVEDTTVEEAQAQFDVNFFGVLRLCRAALPLMRAQKSGCIVNMSSIGGFIGIPFQGFYSATKFALEGFSEALRLEVRRFGIRVVLVEPGDHRTAFTEKRRWAKAAESEGSAYGERCRRAIARMAVDEQAGSPPDAIARLIHEVLQDPNPRLRYTVGPAAQRAAVWLKRGLPYAVIERLMRDHYQC